MASNSAAASSTEHDKFFALLMAGTDQRVVGETVVPSKAPPAGATFSAEASRSLANGANVFRSVAVAPASTSPFQSAHHHGGVALREPSTASASWAQKSDGKADAWMGMVSNTETQPFKAPKIQPFYHDDTVTQFESTKPSEEIFSSLLRAMREMECMYSVNRESGLIKFLSFVDHTRVSATFRVYLKTPGTHLVHYGRNFGGRIPATRLFFNLANASGLVQLQVPRLLRSGAPRDCCSQTQSDKKADSPAPLTVFVEMLSSVFSEEALVGAQGLARACCCIHSAKAYVAHLPAIFSAFRQHQQSGTDHIVSRDVVTCLAGVIERVGVAALRSSADSDAEPVRESLESLLQVGAQVEGDILSARASIRCVASLCEASAPVKSAVLSEHRDLAVEALQGKGPCSAKGSSAPFVKACAERLSKVLGL